MPATPQSKHPETDLFITQIFNETNRYTLLTQKCRTLEQQRDEAVADALKWKEQNELGNCEISERGRIIKQLTLERDSLREQLSNRINERDLLLVENQSLTVQLEKINNQLRDTDDLPMIRIIKCLDTLSIPHRTTQRTKGEV